jgi:hypothetical protein
MGEFKQRLSDYYKEKIIARAKALAKENREKKEADEKRMREAQSEGTNTTWTFKGVKRVADTEVVPAKP